MILVNWAADKVLQIGYTGRELLFASLRNIRPSPDTPGHSSVLG
jgi:hypothetical protein